MKLAVIPARGGSKRIPRKNIRDFCGKPIIAWSIEAALDSGCFDRVIVSTDDSEIAEVARTWGAQVPFIRPVQLSDDFTGILPVIRHAITWLMNDGDSYDHVCCIYATAPFIRPQDLQNGLETMLTNRCEYSLAVTSYAFPIQRAVYITPSGHLKMFDSHHFSTRSQDLVQAYHDAGQFVWGLTEAWINEAQIFSERTSPVILPRHRVEDIDTMEDWVRAELLFKLLNT